MMIRNVQTLRAIAAALVMLSHFATPFDRADGRFLSPVFDTLKPIGWVGVDVFFVISGYIISVSTTRYGRSATSAVTFIGRRLARIYLGFWPWCAVMAGLIWSAGLTLDGYHLWQTILLTRHDGSGLILPVAWSLAFEIDFYLVFAVLLMVPTRVRLAVLSVWGLVGLLAEHEPLIPQWLASPYITEFVFGVWIAARPRDRVIPPLIPASAAVVAFAIGWLSISPDDLALRALTYGVFAAASLLTAVEMERRNLVAVAVTQRLGDASYSIYLSHVPGMFLLQFVAPHFADSRPSLAYGGLAVVIATVSWVWFAMIERPLYRGAAKGIEGFVTRASAAFRPADAAAAPLPDHT